MGVNVRAWLSARLNARTVSVAGTLAGLGSVVAGIALISVPAAFIVAGVAGVAVSLFLIDVEPRR